MDDGVGTVGMSCLAEEGGAGGEAVELHELPRSKVAEPDELFEEAFDVTPRVDSEAALASKAESEEVGKSLKVGDPTERFEEAKENPTEVQKSEEGLSIVVHEQISTKKDSRGHVNGAENNELADREKVEVKEGIVDQKITPEKSVGGNLNQAKGISTADSGIDGENELQDTLTEDEMDAENLVNQKKVDIGKSENGFLSSISTDGPGTYGKSENSDAMNQKLEVSSGVESRGCSSVEEGGVYLLKKSEAKDLQHLDNIVVNGMSDTNDSLNLNDDCKNEASKVAGADCELAIKQTVVEKPDFLDQGPCHQEVGGAESFSAPDIFIGKQDINHGEMQDTSSTIESSSAEEMKQTGEVGSQPSSEVSTLHKGDTVQGASSNLEVSGEVPIDSEKKIAKEEAVKQINILNGDQDNKPIEDVNLSTTKSTSPVSILTPTPTSKVNPARPAGLGSAAPLLESAPRIIQQSRVNGATSPMQNQVVEENGEAEEADETREKLQMIRVKFLRLAHRLGQTPHNGVVAQVLYRLGLAEQLKGRTGSRVAAFSFDRASAMAEHLEAAGQEPLDFSCTIMVLGKTGVGKSATINSIFNEVKFNTDAFHLGTKKVQEVEGTVQGIRVRVIDTPGLLPSWGDQRRNDKILQSVKRFIQKTPPDIVLYLDRLDMQSRDFGDMPLLRTVTDIFGPSIWFNAIVVLTHAASAPPEGPNGTVTSYDMFVTQRTHVVQQAIRQAAGDMRLMNPVSLVENHSACRTNRAGQRVLPNGQVWKPHLLLLSFASKILSEANKLLKLQDNPPGRPFATRIRAPPLPVLLSNLLQSRPQLKLPQEQFGDDDDIAEYSDDESSEYDELPPFKHLTESQLVKLSKDHKKAYYDELEYREKLFMKKQLKEERKRRKMMKKMDEAAQDLPTENNVEDDSGGAATVPVHIQDMNLPATFDSDNPTHRYRSLDLNNQWLVRPVLDAHSWDHDVGYEGINAESLFVLKEKIPVSFSGQVSMDKKDVNLQMELASSMKHGEGKSSTLAFDMQNVGKEIAYTLRSETRFMNYLKNKGTAGLSLTNFGNVLTGGVKFEDKWIVNRRGHLVMAGGAIFGRGDVAYGGSLEATLRDKDHPVGRFLSTFGLSVMDWHGDLAVGWNVQTQIPIGRFTNVIGRVNLNNRGSGQVSIRLNSSEQFQIALASLIPLVSKFLGYYQNFQ